jgi:uncharacterized repeat protein (TIGR01451 family)
LPTLWEDALTEKMVMDETDAYHQFVFTSPDPDDPERYVKNLWPLDGNTVGGALFGEDWIDWNGDGLLTPDADMVPLNINTATYDDDGNPIPSDCENDTTDQKLRGSHDWVNISMPFRDLELSLDVATNPTTSGSPTGEERIRLVRALHTADLSISAHNVPETVVAGATFTYELTVTNHGPNPSAAVHVTDTLPDGLRYDGGSPECSAADDTVTCDLGYMLRGDSSTVSISVLVDAGLMHEAGGPLTITNTAGVATTGVGHDPDTSNNSVEFQVEVVGESDLEAVSLTAPDAPVEVLLDQPTAVGLAKTLANHGPSGPTDVGLEIDASESAAFTVELAGPLVVEALGVGEERAVTEMVAVTCVEPGFHDISITNRVFPVTPGVSDPNPTNTEASTELTIHCVVPVAINIMPGGFPNPINLDSEGVIPVAVLTTDEGEYGLPRAFDATFIDPASVLFGRAENLFGTQDPSGAPAFQNRGHIEDAYELDQETKDGDLDMVLRFRVSETGLIESDTQACLRGEAETADGWITFFGCDEIVVRP